MKLCLQKLTNNMIIHIIILKNSLITYLHIVLIQYNLKNNQQHTYIQYIFKNV